MATQKAISGNVTKTYGSSTVYTAGTVANPDFNAVALTTSAYEDGIVGSKVVVGSTAFGVKKANTSAPIAFQEQGAYIGKLITSTIAGIANTVLRGGADSYARRPIQAFRGYTARGYHDWSYASGTPILIDTNVAGSSVLPLDISGSESYFADNAAFPTDAIPGELTYEIGAATPTNADYPAKT